MEMTAVVVLHGHHLCQVFRRLYTVAAVQVMLALGILPLIVLTPRVVPATVFLVLSLLLYAGLKGRGISRGLNLLKQMRLEENFLRQIRRSEHLRSLLNGEGHVWSSSRLWMGLQSIVSSPLPDLLHADEKLRRLQRHFHRAVRDLQPSSYNLEAAVLVLSILFWEALGDPAMIGAGANQVVAGFWAALLALEALQSGLQWSLGHAFEKMEEALARWTLANELEHGVAPPGRSYVHRLLYHARPWFLQPRARMVSRSVKV